MKKYHFKLPLLKLSTASITVKDDNDHSIGSIQRTFRNHFNKALCWVIDNLELSFAGKDKQLTVIVKIRDNYKWFGRNEWSVTISKNGNEDTFLLKDKTKVRTHPRFQFNIAGQSYVASKDLLDKKALIMNSTRKITVCEIEHESIMKYSNRGINMYEDELCPIYVACLDHLIKTMY
jgi:hypothetical protein